MPFKDVLVHVDHNPDSQGRLRLACEIARSHAAHLIGLYCIEPLPILAYSPWGDPGYTDFAATQQIKEQYQAATFGAMAQAKTAFRAETDRVGIMAEWRVGEGALDATLIQQARCVDLTVVGQTNAGRVPIGRGLPEEVVLASGRPTLIVPALGQFDTVSRRVLVAWNASREAARAVGDALPLLSSAQAVTVLSIGSKDLIEREHRSADIVAHLARHGVNAVAAASTAQDIDVGEVLLSHAANHSADLIVMGAYGHSRSREWLLGGATRQLLRSMTVPVLMAH